MSRRVVSRRGFLSSLSLLPPPSYPQECPSGIVNEENFKQIYSQFFPQGKETSPWGEVLEEIWKCQVNGVGRAHRGRVVGSLLLSGSQACSPTLILQTRAHTPLFLFNAFDTNRMAPVSFEVSWRRWAREACFLGLQGQAKPRELGEGT